MLVRNIKNGKEFDLPELTANNLLGRYPDTFEKVAAEKPKKRTTKKAKEESTEND